MSSDAPDGLPPALDVAANEVEEFVGSAGWDRSPALFALVRTADLVRDDPDLAGRLGLDPAAAASVQGLTPMQQEDLPEGDLDEVLAHIGWPEQVAGCALTQEIVILPPGAAEPADAAEAAQHPDRREARLVVAVLRDGTSASLLRLRDTDELLTGPDLAPNLVAALVATLTAE